MPGPDYHTKLSGRTIKEDFENNVLYFAHFPPNHFHPVSGTGLAPSAPSFAERIAAPWYRFGRLMWSLLCGIGWPFGGGDSWVLNINRKKKNLDREIDNEPWD